ncbi:MAG: hypothetical protein MJZ95_00880 [Paludibacteraceae bacterium]|nr:hypothetical protein [Paludibacteraceae bacterium]
MRETDTYFSHDEYAELWDFFLCVFCVFCVKRYMVQRERITTTPASRRVSTESVRSVMAIVCNG